MDFPEPDAGYSVGWGGETADWKEISCKEEVLLLLLKHARDHGRW